MAPFLTCAARAFSSCAVLAVLTAPAAFGQDSKSLWDYAQGAPTFKDTDGNKLKFRGRILWDIASLEEEVGGVSDSTDDNEFRAARLGLEGQYSDVKYKFEVDFAGRELEVKDLFATYVGSLVNITIGQQKTPNSLEEEMSSRHIDFLERSQLTDAFGFDRRVGVAVSDGGSNYSWRAGVFTTSINGMQDNQDENTVAALRGTYAFINQNKNVLHIGGSYRYTDEDNSGAPGRSSRWGAHLANIKTKPDIGADANLFALETAYINGPFSAQAEYVTEEGDTGSADGYYVNASYSLTGESRVYKGSAGVIDRVKPLNPLSKGGAGAVKLAARYDVIDAEGAGGQETTAISAGVVWTLESHLNIKAEYISADGGSYDADGLQMRIQYDW